MIWKSKTIAQVCKSVKAAETRSLDKAVDDGVYCARTIHEIYKGRCGDSQIPVTCVTDSQSLIDSINSTKKVDEKLMRPLIMWFQQAMEAQYITELRWCDTKVCVADMLTKAGSSLTDTVREKVQTGRMIDLTETFK